MLPNPLIKNSCSDWLRILRKQMYALNRPWFEQTRHQIFINQLNLEKIFNMLINFIKKKKSRTFLFTWHSSDYYVTFSHICTHWAVKCQDKLTELKGEQLSSFLHSYLHHGMMSQACQSVCVTVLFFLPNFQHKFSIRKLEIRRALQH